MYVNQHTADMKCSLIKFELNSTFTYFGEVKMSYVQKRLKHRAIIENFEEK